MKHISRHRVRTFECDFYGHVNGAVYLQYLEWGRWEFLHHAGLSLQELREQGYMIVVTEVHLRYHSSALPEEELCIETELQSLRRVSGVFFQRIYKAQTGKLVLEGRVHFAFLSSPEAKLTAIPPEVRQKLTQSG